MAHRHQHSFRWWPRSRTSIRRLAVRGHRHQHRSQLWQALGPRHCPQWQHVSSPGITLPQLAACVHPQQPVPHHLGDLLLLSTLHEALLLLSHFSPTYMFIMVTPACPGHRARTGLFTCFHVHNNTSYLLLAQSWSGSTFLIISHSHLSCPFCNHAGLLTASFPGNLKTTTTAIAIMQDLLSGSKYVKKTLDFHNHTNQILYPFKNENIYLYYSPLKMRIYNKHI